MTKMEMLVRFYERHEELERKLDAAENDGNTRAIEACQKGQQSKQHSPQQEPAQPQYKQPTAFDNLGTQVPFDEEVPF